MKSIIKGLSEYFLGTETKKHFNNYRRFLMEHNMDSKNLEYQLKDSRLEEIRYMMTNKYIPDIGEVIAGTYGIFTGDFSVLGITAAIAEPIRISSNLIFPPKKYIKEKRKEIHEESHKDENGSYDRSPNYINDIIKNIEDKL